MRKIFIFAIGAVLFFFFSGLVEIGETIRGVIEFGPQTELNPYVRAIILDHGVWAMGAKALSALALTSAVLMCALALSIWASDHLSSGKNIISLFVANLAAYALVGTFAHIVCVWEAYPVEWIPSFMGIFSGYFTL